MEVILKMKKYNYTKIFFFIFALSVLSINAQDIFTKDDHFFGTKDNFVKSCIDGAKKKTINLKGIDINMTKYCSCVCDNLIPSLYLNEITTALEQGKLMELFLNDENFNILMSCVDGNFEIEDDYEFKDENQTELTKTIQIKQCVNEILSSDDDNTWNTEMASEYCTCAMERLYSKGFTYKDLLDIENEDSESFNEIVMPCLNEMASSFEKNAIVLENSYNVEDIIGSPTSSKIKLIEYINQGYKIKVDIDGVIKYFLFDTGASDLIINRDIERELLINGSLKKEHYKGKEIYTLADNTQVEADMVILNNIKIGDYTLNNVYCAIMENGSLLCGKGFFDKFKSWEFSKVNKEILVYK